MIQGIWGKKIGMTQVFSENNRVVPVTVIDVSKWLVTQVKTKGNDGYSAVQLSRVRDDYVHETFSSEWLKDSKKYFSAVREVPLHNVEQTEQAPDQASLMTVGQQADIAAILAQGDSVDVTGITIGRGFQGGMKRHGFSGGRASHGSKLGRKPGSLAGFRRQGRVPPGKRMPGHMGVERRVMKNLKVVKVEPTAHILFIGGSVPGKSGSLVFVQKRG